MPLYEYECDACGHRFEKIVKFSDPPVETCPKCGGAIHKLISAPAFQLKGTGWYATDYPKKDAGAGKPEGGAKDADSGETNPQSGRTDKTDKTDGTNRADGADRADASQSSAKSEKTERPAKNTSTTGDGGSSGATSSSGSAGSTSKPNP